MTTQAISRRRRLGRGVTWPRLERLEERTLLSVAGDFNRDGLDDLAIGIPGRDVGGISGAGAVQILYGTRTGPTATGNQLWTQDSPGILDSAETGDRFGTTLAAGDFNGDGYDDLAIGVPDESVGTEVAAGAVHVLYGSAAGLRSLHNQFWTQDSPGVANSAEAYDAFGASLAVGDFNGDSRSDLAIGVPMEDGAPDFGDAGAVQVLYGSAKGLRGKGSQYWTQAAPGLFETSQKNDRFGWSLAAGDFNGDGRDDLAVGVPFEDLGDLTAIRILSAGAVHIIFGTARGLNVANDQLWTQDSRGIGGVAEPGDRFGSRLAAGDFNGDGRDDLAVGVPAEDFNGITDAGIVQVLYGAAGGLTEAGDQSWSQDSPGIADSAESGDSFGVTLAAGDFNNDGHDDLAIGVPYEDTSTAVDVGIVQVLYGSAASGLQRRRSQIWSQGSMSIGAATAHEANDRFGYSLVVGGFNAKIGFDLVIGVPYEALGTTIEAGVVHLIFGSRLGLVATGNQIWTQNSPGLGTASRFNRFGWAVG